MNSSDWLLDHGIVPYGDLIIALDDAREEQRKLCHDKIVDHIKDFPRDSDLSPWYECADMCLNATWENNE